MLNWKLAQVGGISSTWDLSLPRQLCSHNSSRLAGSKSCSLLLPQWPLQFCQAACVIWVGGFDVVLRGQAPTPHKHCCQSWQSPGMWSYTCVSWAGLSKAGVQYSSRLAVPLLWLNLLCQQTSLSTDLLSGQLSWMLYGISSVGDRTVSFLRYYIQRFKYVLSCYITRGRTMVLPPFMLCLTRLWFILRIVNSWFPRWCNGPDNCREHGLPEAGSERDERLHYHLWQSRCWRASGTCSYSVGRRWQKL